MQAIYQIISKITRTQAAKRVCLLLIFMMGSQIMAHAGSILGGGLGPDLVHDADAPIDGGLSLLIAGGVGYGVRKIKQQKAEKR